MFIVNFDSFRNEAENLAVHSPQKFPVLLLEYKSASEYLTRPLRLYIEYFFL